MSRTIILLAFATLSLSTACGPQANPDSPPSEAGDDVEVTREATDPMQDPTLVAALESAAAGVENEELIVLLREHWLHVMSTSPIWASMLGVHAFDDQIGDSSHAGILAAREANREFLARARAIDASALNQSDGITLSLFLAARNSEVADEVCEDHTWGLSPRYNPVTVWNYLPQMHSAERLEDARALAARYEAVSGSIDDTIDNLRRGAAEGRFANAESTRRVIDVVDKQLAEPRHEWPLMKPLSQFGDDWPEEERIELEARFRAAVNDGIAPALQRYRDLLTQEILPKARVAEESGVKFVPGGLDCYAGKVRHYTTLDVSPEAVHEIGLAEVERVNSEMRALGETLFGEKDLPAVLDKLRTDPTLYFATEDEVQKAAEDALAAAKAKMPEYFGILPQAECVVERIPDYEAPYTTIAYYRQPNPDGSKPGEYFVNTYKPETRPKFEAQVLAYHEAIPGHHLQIAISQELPATPAFIRHGGWTVFVEGWALYTERLADEMGLYATDLDRMGMLSFDAWRATRLVVDTGIHHFGWSRDQAKAYMLEHTALTAHNIDNEVDRYITWPGQALAYKTGQLHILELRAKLQEELGEAFDIKRFHDAVLEHGAVTLEVLDRNVRAAMAAPEP